MHSSPRRVVVVGGGISGLRIALALLDGASRVPGGAAVTLLEASDRLGGLIKTTAEAGYVVEGGPQGFLDNVPATLDLVERLGLRESLVRADGAAARRYLFVRGALHPLPMGPGSLLRSPILSVAGRLRLLAELASSRGSGADETVGTFARRHLGSEATRTLVDPMVSGVFAGDVERLSVCAAFPRLAAMEAEHGSLLRAMIAGRKAGRLRGTLTSFVGGMQTLVDALCAALGSRVRLGCPAQRVVQAPDGGWTVEVPGGGISADSVVLAVPAHVAGTLLDGLTPAAVPEVPHVPIAAVALGFRAEAVPRELDGFGFLVPRSEGVRTLGCLWESAVFPGSRAPDGHHLLRVMVGGAHDPTAPGLDDAALLALVGEDLRAILGISEEPTARWIARWPRGIANYEVGHQARLRAFRDTLPPGLSLLGSSWDGVAVNACIDRAQALADDLLARWATP